MNNKHVYKFSVLIFVACIFLIITVLYWINHKYDPYTFKIQPIPVEPPVVKRGEFIIKTFDYCKNNKGREIVERYLVTTDIKVELPQQSGNSPVGCYVVNHPIRIPKQVSPGVYHVEYKIKTKVNPLRTVESTLRSADFEVK